MNEFDLENGMEIDGLDSYSGKNVSVDDIEEENVTLMMIGIDCSGSMWSYEGTMRQCLSDFRDAQGRDSGAGSGTSKARIQGYDNTPGHG